MKMILNRAPVALILVILLCFQAVAEDLGKPILRTGATGELLEVFFAQKELHFKFATAAGKEILTLNKSQWAQFRKKNDAAIGSANQLKEGQHKPIGQVGGIFLYAHNSPELGPTVRLVAGKKFKDPIYVNLPNSRCPLDQLLYRKAEFRFKKSG
jgi:hypothetical protein